MRLTIHTFDKDNFRIYKELLKLTLGEFLVNGKAVLV